MIPQVPIGEIASEVSRPVALEPGVPYRSVGVKWYGAGVHVHESREGHLFDAARFKIEQNDLIYNDMWARMGSVAIVPPELAGSVASSHFPTFRLDESKVFPSYLSWYFRTPSFWHDCDNASRGSTGRNQIKRSTFTGIHVPLPPLDEQRRIVVRIEELAAKVVEARGMRVVSAEGMDALTTSAAARILEALTKTAPRLALGSLVTVRGGGTPSKDAPHFWGGDIPWITPKDMKRRVLADAVDHITEIASKESPAKLIAPGAVLVVVRGMILAHTFPAALLHAPATINQDMKALIPDARILPEYLCAVLWAWNPRVLGLVDRSGHDTRKLNTDKLLSFEIPVPSILVQERVIAELDALQAKVDAVKALQTEAATELDAMLPAILDKAFKGEL